LAVALGMASDRMCRVQTFDPSDAVVDEFGAVARWWRFHGGSERIEGRLDQLGAAATGVCADGNELVVCALLHQAIKLGKREIDLVAKRIAIPDDRERHYLNSEALPRIGRIYAEKGVEMRCCPESRDILAKAGVAGLKEATEEDFYAEFLAPIIAIRTLAGIDEAMEHIARFGSQHTDAIVTEDWSRAQRFLREVDSSSVMVNASTRFADGFEYGLGAEIGISTNKLHARGPVGLEGLTSQKWIVLGDGQVRG